jgi:starch synthase (maltosyl-transferring)
VVVENVEPLVDGGLFPAKATVGDPLRVAADVFSHGHEAVRAIVRMRRRGERSWLESPLTSEGNDRFSGTVVPFFEGPFEIEIVAARDELATFARHARRRLDGGAPNASDAEELAGLVDDAVTRLAAARGVKEASAVSALAEKARRGISRELLDELDCAAPFLALRAMAPAESVVVRLAAVASREKAAFSTWYELFPRSASSDPSRPGTLADVVSRLGYVAELGFDVLYLPPIHPIGLTARKGRGNSPAAAAGDVGSPWAIGAPEGGHTAIASELGTLEDFDKLVAEAAARDIEIALDLAFQCSPDHPWVTEHPDWFRHRPDGSIACAENPPKRYEDIYPLDFATRDRDGLWNALLEVVLFWAERGVRIFRVDNPHTKPFSFWEWLLAEARKSHDDLVFLAEAFTRPKVMHRLAKLGFDQSYTYFTWRETKWEIEDYFRELASPPGSLYFRPNVWPNTPDILARSLQHGGRASFITRLVLAGGLSANYGIYGPVFELGWDEPAAPGSEEYLASEKYEVHHHDLDDPASIRDVVSRLNAARRQHKALQRNLGLRFHDVDNRELVCWSKRSESGDCVIGVVNLDWRWPQSGFVNLESPSLGLAAGERFLAADALSGERYQWVAGRNFVRLDPAGNVAHLLAVERGEP